MACIVANIKRSAFAVTGISVGLSAVVGVSLVNQSAEYTTAQSFARLGLNLVTLQIERTMNAEGAIEGDLSDVVEQVAPLIDTLDIQPEKKWQVAQGECNVSRGAAIEQISVMSMEPELLEQLAIEIFVGRSLNKYDRGKPWILIGSDTANYMAEQGQVLTPGEPLLLCGHTAYIAGILDSARAGLANIGIDLDSAGIIDSATFRAANVRPIKFLWVFKLFSENSAAAAIAHLKALSEELSDIAYFDTRSAQELIALKREQLIQNNRFALWLSAISLFVGGLGVMNIMLMSGLERRYDIAVCMALGATRLSIAWQFLVESIFLGLAGGLFGIIIGYLFGGVALASLDLAWSPDYAGAIITMGLGVVIGALSGLYPAIAASKLDPASILAS